MPRPIDGWATLGSVLHRVLLVGAPAWVRPATVAAARSALASLRRDALEAITCADTREAPALLGMGRTPYMAARAPGGWLSLDAPAATLAEVWGEGGHGAATKRG